MSRCAQKINKLEVVPDWPKVTEKIVDKIDFLFSKGVEIIKNITKFRNFTRKSPQWTQLSIGRYPVTTSDPAASICSRQVRSDSRNCVKLFVYISKYFSGKWSDCQFLLGSEGNQQTLACHKIILAMASPVFEAMFYGSFNQKDDPIVISDVQVSFL